VAHEHDRDTASPPWSHRVTVSPPDRGGRLAGAGRALGWTVVALLIAAGSAGIVVGLDHVPGTAARAELTWDADRAASAELDAIQAGLESLQPRVEELGVQGRGALASLAGQDLETVQAAVNEGSRLVAAIRDDSAALRRDLARVPGVSGPLARLTTAQAVRDRHAAMLEALDATEGLDAAWARLTVGSIAAARLSGLLADHDRTMVAAIEAGRAARYEEANGTIDQATALLDQAQELRRQLANTVDVSTLDEWLRRNRAFDDALRTLYAALDESGGQVNDAVRDALAAQQAARDQLPPDSRGLIVIMSEIGRGGLNGAVITIEQARGALAAAVAGLNRGEPGP
jgi:hypothetical protein